jgi:hypothetical protein
VLAHTVTAAQCPQFPTCSSLPNCQERHTNAASDRNLNSLGASIHGSRRPWRLKKSKPGAKWPKVPGGMGGRGIRVRECLHVSPPRCDADWRRPGAASARSAALAGQTASTRCVHTATRCNTAKQLWPSGTHKTPAAGGHMPSCCGDGRCCGGAHAQASDPLSGSRIYSTVARFQLSRRPTAGVSCMVLAMVLCHGDRVSSDTARRSSEAPRRRTLQLGSTHL